MQYDTRPLREYIAKHESHGDYNIVWGNIGRHDQPPKPLVKMTIGEVLAWQDSIDRKYMSEAAGKYQIMEDTLRDLYVPAGLKSTDLFNERNQDLLADALLRRRGLADFINGRITREHFANNIAREWASMPVVTGAKRGLSYYAGDGLNKAHGKPEEILAAIDAIKRPARPPASGGFGWLLTLLANLFGRRK